MHAERLFRRAEPGIRFHAGRGGNGEKCEMPGVLYPRNGRAEKPVEPCGGGAVFCNPPYGREVGKWVRKAYEEAQSGTTVVLLIPARTDTTYFHDYIYGKAEIRFIRGRLRFTDEEGNAYAPAPFPSMVVVYNGKGDSA